MKTYYWKGKKNFGDLLTPLLLEHFCHLKSEWSEAKDAELVMVGSILGHMPAGWNGVTVGAGLLHEHSTFLTSGEVLSVRGPLTLARTYRISNGKGWKRVVQGDMGLLADELVGDQDKIYNLGLVPHWSDTTLEKNPIFLKYNPKIIRVSDDPLEVIRQIGQCKKIVSSSLHGIILADAYGIPRRIEISPEVLAKPKQEGGLFKWHDYSLSIGLKLEIGKLQTPERNTIIDKQHELFDVLEEVKSIFKK